MRSPGLAELFITADTVPSGSTIRADVVIAGAGAAGITIARELAGTDLKVVVLESGGFEYERETQALYYGTVSGSPYDLEGSRLRFFGGTTNHWGGWVRPLDDSDFAGRDWIPGTGWPIERAELDPYYARAFEITSQLDDRNFVWEDWRTEPALDVSPLIETENFTSAIYRISPVRFNDTYRPDLEAADNVTVYLRANLVDIRLDESDDVEAFGVATLQGNTFEVVGSQYVLALGAIDNARMLLRTPTVPSGPALGDHSDKLGRYFMDHIEAPVGTVVLSTDLPDVYKGGNQGLVRAALTLTPEAQQAHELGGVAFVLEEGPRWEDPNHPEELPPEVVAGVLGALQDSEPTTWVVHVRAEPQPNPASRITINGEVDALGVNTVDVHRELTAEDHARLGRAVELLASELGEQGAGWMRIDAPGLGENDSSLFYGFHHMGTTRMSVDPADGVVDPDGRVHGSDNLWVAGSSVFPSVGYANPTLTIVALALRMSDQLAAG